VVHSLLTRTARRFRTWPADDYGGLSNGSDEDDPPGAPAALPPLHRPERPPRPLSIAPETFEVRWTKLHSEGRLYEMWDMLAEDAQRAWGGRQRFMSLMPKFARDTVLLDVQVVDLKMLERWVDEAHQRTYRNVARMLMRYRVHHSGTDSTFEQQVHLIPAAAGWRTLCYPSSRDLTVGSAVGR